MKYKQILAVLFSVLFLATVASSQQQGPFPAYWTALSPPQGYQIGPVWLLTNGTILAGCTVRLSIPLLSY